MAVAQPLKIHGGKGAFAGKLAKWIISLMPPHTHYCEPYFGGGSVLLRKSPDGISEVVNDLDGDLMNFWRTLQDQRRFRAFVKRLSVIPLSEAEFNLSRGLVRTDVERAVAFFVRARQSRQGLRKDYVTPTKRTRRGMNENVSAWLSAVDGLKEVRDRLILVEVLNRKAVDVIQERDHEDALFYCDPPYLKSTRTSGGEYGPFEMTEADHVVLLQTLARLRGKFLLSGYNSPLYEHWREFAGWRRHELTRPNSAAGTAVNPERIECIWTNF